MPIIFINLVSIYGGSTMWQMIGQNWNHKDMWFLLSKLDAEAPLRKKYSKNHFQILQTWLHFRRPMDRYIRKLYYGITDFFNLSLLNSYLTSMGHGPAACGYEWSNTGIKHKYHKSWLPPASSELLSLSLSSRSPQLFLGAPGVYRIWWGLPASCSSIAHCLLTDQGGHLTMAMQPASSKRRLLHCVGVVQDLLHLQNIPGAKQCSHPSGPHCISGSTQLPEQMGRLPFSPATCMLI